MAQYCGSYNAWVAEDAGRVNEELDLNRSLEEMERAEEARIRMSQHQPGYYDDEEEGVPNPKVKKPKMEKKQVTMSQPVVMQRAPATGVRTAAQIEDNRRQAQAKLAARQMEVAPTQRTPEQIQENKRMAEARREAKIAARRAELEYARTNFRECKDCGACKIPMTMPMYVKQCTACYHAWQAWVESLPKRECPICELRNIPDHEEFEWKRECGACYKLINNF